MKNNLNNNDKNRQLKINGKRIFNYDNEPLSIKEFIKVETAIYKFLSRNNSKLDETEIIDKLLNKFLATSTKEKLIEFKIEEKKHLNIKQHILEEKLDIKSYFLFKENPLILSKKIDNTRIDLCWKCKSPVLIEDTLIYKCPNCGFFSYKIEANGKTIIQDEAEYWNNGINKDGIIVDYENFENILSSSNIDLVKMKEEFARIRNEKQNITEIEICLAILNNLVNLHIKNNDYFCNISNLYESIAHFAWKHGIYFYELLYNSRMCDLYEFKSMGCKTVEIEVSCGCESCRKLEGKKMKLESAMKKMPIPNRKCENFEYYCEDYKRLNKNGYVMGFSMAHYVDSDFNIKLY